MLLPDVKLAKNKFHYKHVEKCVGTQSHIITSRKHEGAGTYSQQ